MRKMSIGENYERNRKKYNPLPLRNFEVLERHSRFAHEIIGFATECGRPYALLGSVALKGLLIPIPSCQDSIKTSSSMGNAFRNSAATVISLSARKGSASFGPAGRR